MNNNAYDLTLFEPLSVEEQEKEIERIAQQRRERINKKRQAAFTKKAAIFLSGFFIFFGLNTLMILNKVEINSLMREQSQIMSEVQILESENVRIRSEVKARISHGNVTDYVENELGMIKATSSQITYINTAPEGDRIVVSGDKTLKK